MSYTEEQWRKAITKLLRLTSQNELKWEHSELFKPDPEVNSVNSFMAEQDGKIYVVSETSRRQYYEEFDFVWVTNYHFSIFIKVSKIQNERIGISPPLSAIAVLYEAAEANMAYNRNALDGLLD